MWLLRRYPDHAWKLSSRESEHTNWRWMKPFKGAYIVWDLFFFQCYSAAILSLLQDVTLDLLSSVKRFVFVKVLDTPFRLDIHKMKLYFILTKDDLEMAFPLIRKRDIVATNEYWKTRADFLLFSLRSTIFFPFAYYYNSKRNLQA